MSASGRYVLDWEDDDGVAVEVAASVGVAVASPACVIKVITSPKRPPSVPMMVSGVPSSHATL